MTKLGHKWRYFIGIYSVAVFLAGLLSYNLYLNQKQQQLVEIDTRLSLAIHMARQLAGENFDERINSASSVSPQDFLTIRQKYDALSHQLGVQSIASYLKASDDQVFLTSSSSNPPYFASDTAASFFQITSNSDFLLKLQQLDQPIYFDFAFASSSGRMLLMPFQDQSGRRFAWAASMAKPVIDQLLMPLQKTAWTIFIGVLGFVVLAALLQKRWFNSQSNPVGEAGLLKALINTLPDLIWVKDANGVYIACNREFEKLYGASETEIIGKTDYDFVKPELAAIIRQHDRAAIEQARPNKNEEWLVYADHTHQGLMETTKTPIYSEQGQLLGVLGVAHDITAYREQEKALRRESEKNLAILHNASDGIHILDQDGSVLEASDSFYAMLGYSREEAVGLNVADWDAHYTPEELLQILRNQFVNPVRFLFETLHKRRDGSVFQVEVSCLPLQIEDQPVLFCSSRNMTARKQIELSLQRSEATLKRAQEIAQIGSWFLDIPSGNLEWSLEVYRIFGVDPKEKITLERFQACLHPDDVERVLEAWNAAMAGANYDINHRIQRGDEVRWVREMAQIDFAKDGRPLTGIGTVQDITDIQQLTEALRINQDRLYFALQGATDGLWDWNLETNEVYFSPRWFEMLGYAEDEWPQYFDTWAALVHPDDKQSALQHVSAYLEGRVNRYEIEFRMRHKQGHWLYILSRAKLATDQAGKPLSPRRLVGTHVDVTERKQAEQALADYRLHLEDMVQARTSELEVANQRLSISDQRLSAMLAMSQQVNELSEDQLLQLGIEEAVRLTGSEIGYLHFVNEDQDTLALYTWSENTLKYCQAAYDKHYPVSMAGIWADTVRFKKPAVHNDYQQMTGRKGYPEGHAHLLRHLGVPVLEGDKVVLLMGVGNKPKDYDDSDVNQLQLIGNDLWAMVVRQRITEDLATAREAAEAANRAKSTFLANMSHELRTPMNGILGMTSLALRRVEDPTLREQLQKIDQASQHLLAVINDILDISQIEAERMRLEQIEFKLPDVLDNVTNLIKPKIMEKSLKFSVDSAPEIEVYLLLGDPFRLGQILLNLIGNAVKFTEIGSISLSIHLVEEQDHDVLLRFEVQDTGIGITAADSQRLFTAFEQADGSMTRKYGGTGLGLVISKRLVQMMGGEIGLTSQPGCGTCFWFTVRLPKTLKKPVSIMPINETAEVRLKAEFLGTRILLVEDEPINQEVSCWLLQEVGLIVDLAEDGAQAVEMARQTQYALILMDMQLPVMNGIEATRIIRTLEGYANTPILAMTANAFTEDRLACVEAGMNDHIGKPVVPDSLYDTLLHWLSKVGS